MRGTKRRRRRGKTLAQIGQPGWSQAGLEALCYAPDTAWTTILILEGSAGKVCPMPPESVIDTLPTPVWAVSNRWASWGL